MSVKPRPEGYQSVTPYLIMKNAADASDFYVKAFGASEIMRLVAPTGEVGHAEVQIGDSRVMLADEFPDMGFRGPKTLGGSTVSLMVYVEDVDMQFDKAVAEGCKVLKPLEDQFYGDRAGTLEDPFGYVWTLGTLEQHVARGERYSCMSLILFVLLVAFAALFGSQFEPGDWYGIMVKPPLTPPNWIFAPVWSVLYLLIAIAGWLVWQTGSRLVMVPWAGQLVLNALWSYLFFGLERPGLALVEIVALLALVFATMFFFFRVRVLAGWLFVPYAAWVAFATYLNAGLWYLN